MQDYTEECQALDPHFIVLPWEDDDIFPIQGPEDWPNNSMAMIRKFMPGTSPRSEGTIFTSIRIASSIDPRSMTNEFGVGEMNWWFEARRPKATNKEGLEYTTRFRMEKKALQVAKSVKIGDLVFTSPLVNASRLYNSVNPLIQALAKEDNKGEVKWAFDTSEINYEVIIDKKQQSGTTRRYPLVSNRPFRIECEITHARWFAEKIKNAFNKVTERKHRPGILDARVVLDPAYMLCSSTGLENRKAMFTKHKLFMESVEMIDCSIISNLDSVYHHASGRTTLRKMIMELTYPLVPFRDPISGEEYMLDDEDNVILDSKGKNAKPPDLFHNVDFIEATNPAYSGFKLTTWNNRLNLARRVTEILPAIIKYKLGVVPHGWFISQEAEAICNRVTLNIDTDTKEWLGTWTTQDDVEMRETIFEEIQGVDMEVLVEMNLVIDNEQTRSRPTRPIPCDMSANTSVQTGALGSLLGLQDDDSTIASEQTETPSSQDQGSGPPGVDGQAGSNVGAGESGG